jgi:hypothetical protein
MFGSNSSTSKQTMAAMKAAEMQRAKLIDMINVRTVGASRVSRPLDHDSVPRGPGA